MRPHRLLLAGLLLLPLAAIPARANEAEAKEVARNANCPPGKVEVLRQVPTNNGETVYKISCTAKAVKDAFVLVQCRGSQCTLLR
jgi:hypothetical protein